MKRLFVFILLLLSQASVFAQRDTNNRAFISVEGGFGAPLNSAMMNGVGITTGSTAITGSTFNLSISLPLEASLWSIAGNFSYNYNRFDNPNFWLNTTDAYLLGGTDSLEGSSYKEVSILAGLKRTFKWKRLYWDISFLIGYVNFSSPQIKFTDLFDDYVIKANNSSGLGASIPLDIRYKIGKRWFAVVTACIYYSGYSYKVNYTINQLYSSYPSQIPSPPTTIRQRVYLFEASGGLAYSFGK